ncbi:YncE family protein [Flavobacterium limnophilum]|uniref:YncE family protein n=1 Tax=Flavobacterium limnophilum TaxID=3003262 RepID=UPI00248232D9|nr:hypothetical protein [Flavobacterium limnophilum]
MKAFLYLAILVAFASCSKEEEEGPTVEEVQKKASVSIILPLKDRDYSSHNNGIYGVFENPSDQKTFKGKIKLSDTLMVANTDLKIKWRSNIDGELFVGIPNAKFESNFTTSLTKGLHKIYFEVYLGDNPKVIQKDSITISNVVKLEATPYKGRMMKLNWSKYEGTGFVSYLVYNDSNTPLAEIKDINTLQYDYSEIYELSKEHHYQVVVKTNSPALINETLGSNIVTKITGDFISFPYYVRKMVKDPTRHKLYAIATPKDLDEIPNKYGIVIINTDTFTIESHILTTTRFTDLSVSPDGQYLYLTQRHVDLITKVNLNTFSSSIIYTHTGGAGFENIEAANNNMLYAYVYYDLSNMQLINALTGAYTVATSGFAQGDMRYNSSNDTLYLGESNTSGGDLFMINSSNFLSTLNGFTKYGEVGYPFPSVTISDDMKHIFWDKFQLDKNLSLVRKFNTVIRACSPSNKYLADWGKVYDYSTMNTIFNFPSFGNYEYYNSDTYFIDDNTIITNKTYDPNDGSPSYSCFFRIKI